MRQSDLRTTFQLLIDLILQDGQLIQGFPFKHGVDFCTYSRVDAVSSVPDLCMIKKYETAELVSVADQFIDELLL